MAEHYLLWFVITKFSQLRYSASKCFLGHILLHTANSHKKAWAMDSSQTYVSHGRKNALNYFQIE